MEIRKAKDSDIPEISDLCKICFGNPMSKEHYNWLYGEKSGYCSLVMVDHNKIIAHQAIINREYTYQNKKLGIGLSSGTMITPEYQKTGDFYYLLKEAIFQFSGDIIVGFPNENSHGMLRKLFKFNCIPNNLFQMDLRDEIRCIDKSISDLFIRKDVNWRINKHPFNRYFKTRKGTCEIIWKEYLQYSIDILYTNIINNDFIDILETFKKRYSYINIISACTEQIERIGFRKVNGNEFVYKAFKKEYDNLVFSCQMIDSDIY